MSTIAKEINISSRKSLKSSRIDSMSDSLELIKIAELSIENVSILQTITTVVQKFCNNLDKRMQAMQDRQNRKSAGLFALLKNRI